MNNYDIENIINQLKSPLNPNDGFINGELAAEGVPEFVIPNGPIPSRAKTRVVK